LTRLAFSNAKQRKARSRAGEHVVRAEASPRRGLIVNPNGRVSTVPASLESRHIKCLQTEALGTEPGRVPEICRRARHGGRAL